jgi:hypothetical protein
MVGGSVLQGGFSSPVAHLLKHSHSMKTNQKKIAGGKGVGGGCFAPHHRMKYSVFFGAGAVGHVSSGVSEQEISLGEGGTCLLSTAPKIIATADSSRNCWFPRIYPIFIPLSHKSASLPIPADPCQLQGFLPEHPHRLRASFW